MTDTSLHPAATRRGRRERIIDRLLSRRLMGLRPETCDYTSRRHLRIPMRDGVELLADHYAPTGAALGTVLMRSPYGWEGPNGALYRAQFPARGYHLLLVRCRGTFGSGGTWEPFAREIDDGADTVAWLRRQSWFDGKFATVGGSYLGWTQWALLMDPPPDLATAVIQVGLHDYSRAAYNGGAFNLEDYLTWSDALVHQEHLGPLRMVVHSLRAPRRLLPAMSSLPLADAADDLGGRRAPWFRDFVTHRDLDDPYWARMQLGAALGRVRVPVLLHSGWQDMFLQQTKQQHSRLREHGADVALTVGPWTHTQLGTKGLPMLARETLDWLDEHLAGIRHNTRPQRVRMFVTGADEWRDLADWPEYTADHVLSPWPGGGLSEQPPSAGEARFTYDPANPTPAVGGRRLSSAAGYQDDSKLAGREDVLAFTGAPLTSSLDVIGTPWVELAHHTDNPHADLFVRVSEVDPKGRSRNVSDGFVRLDPGQANGRIRIELDPIAHRFAACNRIRLLVAGGAFPHWERNLGTGEDPATSTTLTPSHRTIDLTASRLHLPMQN